MPRPILATIHPEGLRHNLERARRAVPDARVWAVVKANAYGHGIERAFEGLRSADGFALLDLEEAQRVTARCAQAESVQHPLVRLASVSVRRASDDKAMDIELLTQWLAQRVAALTTEERATLHQAALILTEMSGS